MKATATIVKVEADRVWVRLMPQSGCGRCGEPGGCGAVHLTQAFTAGKAIELDCLIESGEQFFEGETVQVQIARAGALAAMWLGYGWALFLLIIGALCGQWLSPDSELGAVLGAVAGLLLAWLALRVLMQQTRWQQWWQHHGQMRVLRNDGATCAHS